MTAKSRGRLGSGWIEQKGKILPFVIVWMEMENIMLSEISQSEKDKQDMFSFIHGI